MSLLLHRRSLLLAASAIVMTAVGLGIWLFAPRPEETEAHHLESVAPEQTSAISDSRGNWRPRPGIGSLAPGELEGTRVGVSWKDASGQLSLRVPSTLGDAVGEILDLCVSKDAVAAYSGARDIPADPDIVRVVTETQHALGCFGTGPAVMNGRYAYVPPFGWELQFFESRDQAIAYGEDLERRMGSGLHAAPSARIRLGFYDGTVGAVGSSGTRAAAVEEVRVVPESVNIDAGVVRGLVRNLSRTRFAYGLVVRLGGQEWAWPLSVQPGELAPFEIEGWITNEEPLPSEFVASAEMSTDVDLSRQFQFHEMWQRGIIERGDFADYLPDSAIDELPTGTEVATFLTANLIAASSHPSLAELSWNLEAFPLAAYIGWVRSDGSIADVRRTAVSGYDDFIDNDGASQTRPFEVNQFDSSVTGGYVNLAFAPDPRDSPHGGYLLWVGGVFE